MPSDEQDNPTGPPPADGPPSRDDPKGPTVPPVPRPGREDLRRRMKRVDPTLARRYRQKAGQ